MESLLLSSNLSLYMEFSRVLICDLLCTYILICQSIVHVNINATIYFLLICPYSLNLSVFLYNRISFYLSIYHFIYKCFTLIVLYPKHLSKPVKNSYKLMPNFYCHWSSTNTYRATLASNVSLLAVDEQLLTLGRVAMSLSHTPSAFTLLHVDLWQSTTTTTTSSFRYSAVHSNGATLLRVQCLLSDLLANRLA